MKKFFYINQDEAVRNWSNFSRHPVEIRGKVWPTTEHFYQAAKFFNTDPEWAEEIRQVKWPSQSKEMGKDKSRPLDPNWESGLKLQIMLEALLAKAEQCPGLLLELLSTGDAEIVERADWDPIWGDGPNRDGKNFLGRLCMIVRDLHMEKFNELAAKYMPKVEV